MPTFRRRCGFCALFVWLCVAPLVAAASASDGHQILDPSTGEVDGKSALAIYPVRYEGTEAQEVLDWSGFTAHLVAAADHDGELVYPAGTWIAPPAGRYRYWLEAPDRISPFSAEVLYSSGPFDGSGKAGAISVGLAGRLVLPKGFQPADHLQLRLLHLETPQVANLLRWELSRRRLTTDLGDGLQMPTGANLAAIWDRKSGRYVNLSRPFKLGKGQVLEIPIDGPSADRADLLVQVMRAESSPSVADGKVDIVLHRGGRTLAPDLELMTISSVYAIWYDLPPGPAELRAESEAEFLAPLAVDLEAGTIERRQGDMQPRPAVDVEIEMPVSASGQTVLELRTLPTGDLVSRRKLEPDTWQTRFTRLPAAKLDVELRTEHGRVVEQVDLSSGADGFVHLVVDWITLDGQVLFGDEPAAAELTFYTTTRDQRSIFTDDEGAYEFITTEPIRTINIELISAEEVTGREPFVEFFPEALAVSSTRDLVVPDQRLDVRVLDRVTGRGISGAQVTTRNRFGLDDDEGSAAENLAAGRHTAVMQNSTSNDDGWALVPFLRFGEVEIQAMAEGYLAMTEPTTMLIHEQFDQQELEILLDPAGDGIAVDLKLPGGEPAHGAKVLLMDSLEAGTVLFGAQSDASGRVNLPSTIEAGEILIRHPGAAIYLRSWRPQDSDDQVSWQLAPRAAPLTVRVDDPWGQQPLSRAGLALWIDGRRFTGRSLAILSSTRGRTDQNGYWTFDGLPTRPVSILAWGREAPQTWISSSLDALATEIAYPWPELVEIRAASE